VTARDQTAAGPGHDRLRPLLLAGGAFVAVVAVGIALLAPFSGSDSKPTTTKQPAVRVADSKIGRILVNAKGLTLYLVLADKHHRSTCKGTCANVWPPVPGPRPRHPGSGIEVRHLTTTRRSDGRRQLSYYGHPLYTMIADKKPGDLEGEGFGGSWFAVSSKGHPVVAKGTKIKAGGEY
jgi:predicted lipoprotein with Yx(FWY)xxD motif